MSRVHQPVASASSLPRDRDDRPRPGRDAGPLRRWLALLAAVAAAALLATPLPGTAFEPLHEPLEHFPQSTLLVDTGGRSHDFRIWVAATEPRREQGLMWVRSLPPKHGMLFVFDLPQIQSFWMKNTFIPLDLLFIAPDGRVIRIAENARPQSLATIDSMGVVNAVLELPGGTAQSLGIRPGARVESPALKGPQATR